MGEQEGKLLTSSDGQQQEGDCEGFEPTVKEVAALENLLKTGVYGPEQSEKSTAPHTMELGKDE